MALALSIVAIVSIALLLDVTGDCPRGAPDCGEPQWRASFVVLGLGAIWLAYVVVKFIQTKFR